PRRSAGDGSEGRVPPTRPSAARLSARAPPPRGPAREGAASVIHLHGELDAAVHADAVGAGLNRIPVTEVRQVIDVEQEGEAAQVERTVGDHPARAGRVENVSGNLALLLEIDVPAGDARHASVQRQPGDPWDAEAETNVPERTGGVLRRQPVE